MKLMLCGPAVRQPGADRILKRLLLTIFLRHRGNVETHLCGFPTD